MLTLGTVLAFLVTPFMPAKAVPVKAPVDPYSIQGLIAWLETKNPKTKYDYSNPEDCLWERYAKSIGYKDQRSMFIGWNVKHGTKFNCSNLPSQDFRQKYLPYIANGLASEGGNTYGGALQRARLHVR